MKVGVIVTTNTNFYKCSICGKPVWQSLMSGGRCSGCQSNSNKISIIQQAIDIYERTRYTPTEIRMNAKTYADLVSEHGNLLCSVIQTPITIDNNVPENSVWIF